MKGNSEYSGAKDIKILEGLEHVRLRPGMYIGTTGIDGLHHLVYEVLDNSIDEAMAGYCDKIQISFERDENIGEICTVEDNGRGIPVDIHPQAGVSTLEVCLTKLNAGGKFEKGSYKVSGGLHGVGVSCVNALSSWLEATVCRDGKIYRQVYHRGVPEDEVKVIGECDPEKTGTKIRFTPDFEVMQVNSFNYETLSNRFRELSYLNHGIAISITDKRVEPELHEEFHSEGGLKEYVSFLDDYYSKRAIIKPIAFSAVKDDVIVEVALEYNDKYDEKVYSFVNNINTREGGTHYSGFKEAILRVFNQQLQKNQKMLKKFGNDKLENTDINEGLTGVVSVKIANPQFEGQTKMKLGNSNVKPIVVSLVMQKLTEHFEEFPDDINTLLDKAIAAALGRIAARKAREQIRKQTTGLGLPDKLKDCSEKDPALRELFIVEGDSAGGSAAQGRDRKYQAILSLWGKMLNVEKAQEFKVLVNEKLQPVIASIGAGLTRYNNQQSENDEIVFDINKCRYHKIFIMADADVDGSHIRTLLLTFFFRYMRPLIDAGYIYFAMPPLYKITINKRDYYAYDEDARTRIIEEYGNGISEDKIPIQRYKGLGEMNPEQLWETTMNPETRHITQISLNDAEEADRTFAMLMGEDVEPRKLYIEKNATYATIDA
ncbi:MAG: type IIA DNA topoisomerase subunit B [Sphaerochaetaceae bacterium]|nr:type IIA DNA topoisomerase subunit B [Sphaerochaetaceae bacterium]